MRKDKHLTLRKLRLILQICDVTHYQPFTVEFLSSKLGIPEQQIRNELSELKRLGVVKKVGQEGRKKIYRLEPLEEFLGKSCGELHMLFDLMRLMYATASKILEINKDMKVELIGLPIKYQTLREMKKEFDKSKVLV